MSCNMAQGNCKEYVHQTFFQIPRLHFLSRGIINNNLSSLLSFRLRPVKYQLLYIGKQIFPFLYTVYSHLQEYKVTCSEQQHFTLYLHQSLPNSHNNEEHSPETL